MTDQSCSFLLRHHRAMLAHGMERVPSNNQLLVGWNAVASNARPLARNQQFTSCIRLRRNCEAKPRQAPHYRFADGWRILADARREHEAVDAAHSGRQHSRKECNPVDEVIQSQLRPLVRTYEQLPHVAAAA